MSLTRQQFFERARLYGVRLTPVRMWAGSPLLLGSNGTQFEDGDQCMYALLCARDGISDPGATFYKDPYLEEV